MNRPYEEQDRRLSVKFQQVRQELTKENTFNGVEQSPEWRHGFDACMRLVKQYGFGLVPPSVGEEKGRLL